ncbi:YesL family protein [Neobacillus drentensis]|uniref:YesL family protein n=1 Tax=Neobacillus drentensis TaxID=220684 RepID=UPI0008264F4C|nr:DUF624 domain-containing protein [Neobacillus drentensis]
METNRLMNNINVAFDWFIKLFYLNLLWVLFTFGGLVLAGIFPATIALFTVMKSLQSRKNVRVFNEYWNIYKKEFFSANRLGIVLTVIPIIFYTDYLFVNQFSGTIAIITQGILLGCVCLYGITLMYVFPVYIQVKRKLFSTIKIAFLIGIAYPLFTFMMFISIASLLFLFAFLPMAGFLFFASASVFVLSFFAQRLLIKIEVQESHGVSQRNSRLMGQSSFIKKKNTLSKG